MLLPLKNMAGTQVGELEVSDVTFAAPVNQSLMHQALVRQLANARQGSHKTKTRGEVRGGGAKPWRQKGTGRARQGTRTAPNWVGGGTVFGPQPRKYTKAMPRKMRRAALRSALSVKAAGEQVIVLDDLSLDSPKTKAMRSALDALGADEQSVLIVMAEKDENVQRSAGNLPKVKMLLGSYLNIRDLLGHDLILLSKDAAEEIDLWLGSGVDAVATAEIVEAVEAVVEEAAVEDAVVEEVVAETVTEEVVESVEEAADETEVIAEEVIAEEAVADDAAADEVVAEAAEEVEAAVEELADDVASSDEAASTEASEEPEE